MLSPILLPPATFYPTNNINSSVSKEEQSPVTDSLSSFYAQIQTFDTPCNYSYHDDIFNTEYDEYHSSSLLSSLDLEIDNEFLWDIWYSPEAAVTTTSLTGLKNLRIEDDYYIVGNNSIIIFANTPDSEYFADDDIYPLLQNRTNIKSKRNFNIVNKATGENITTQNIEKEPNKRRNEKDWKHSTNIKKSRTNKRIYAMSNSGKSSGANKSDEMEHQNVSTTILEQLQNSNDLIPDNPRTKYHIAELRKSYIGEKKSNVPLVDLLDSHNSGTLTNGDESIISKDQEDLPMTEVIKNLEIKQQELRLKLENIRKSLDYLHLNAVKSGTAGNRCLGRHAKQNTGKRVRNKNILSDGNLQHTLNCASDFCAESSL